MRTIAGVQESMIIIIMLDKSDTIPVNHENFLRGIGIIKAWSPFSTKMNICRSFMLTQLAQGNSTFYHNAVEYFPR